MNIMQQIKRKRIAVIGGGISGMGAAQMLGDTHSVTLLEAAPRLGGHARTVVAGKSGDQPVDTGFIVFNYANYPHLVKMFEQLNVPVVKSNMSFGASLNGGEIEYGTTGVQALFAQPSNLISPNFLRMVRDIFRFNANALRLASDPTLTIGEFLQRLGTGSWFRDYYLMPMSGAIWSTPLEQMMNFPAQALVQFFENHALLSHTGQHQWYTVKGGSREYVSRLRAAMLKQGTQIRLFTPVKAVRRSAWGIELRVHGGDWEAFDEVIFATHSDDTLRMLVDPNSEERAMLAAISYQPNDIILHADASVMPKRRACWSSWVYTEDVNKQSERIDLTYWMNSLQPIPHDDPHFVTLNTTREIKQELIYDQVTLRHPVFDLAALQAQKSVPRINGKNATWFCGAWTKNGFHEDGLSSAVDVAQALNAAVAHSVELV